MKMVRGSTRWPLLCDEGMKQNVKRPNLRLYDLYWRKSRRRRQIKKAWREDTRGQKVLFYKWTRCTYFGLMGRGDIPTAILYFCVFFLNNYLLLCFSFPLKWGIKSSRGERGGQEMRRRGEGRGKQLRGCYEFFGDIGRWQRCLMHPMVLFFWTISASIKAGGQARGWERGGWAAPSLKDERKNCQSHDVLWRTKARFWERERERVGGRHHALE